MSGSGDTREPIGRRGHDRRGQEGKGQQESAGKKRPFSGPLGCWLVGHWIHVGWGEEDRDRNGGEQLDRMTERNKGNGRADCWPSGQVGTGNAVNDASYVL
jgi:hypothetical protein